jgi:Pyruvate/2-oxoacid:ferredoxin oxidoreductase delta subunit
MPACFGAGEADPLIHDSQACRECYACLPVCPVGAIVRHDGRGVEIDRERCVECGTCARSAGCPAQAFRPEALAWPRLIRSLFSDPGTVHSVTGVPGRGTEEMKTNDVTGRFPSGICGVSIEIGRPSLSASFVDIERVTRVCASLRLEFEEGNPLTALLDDRDTGALRPDILGERVLSALIELRVESARLAEVLRTLIEEAGNLDTVFSLGVSRLWSSDGEGPLLDELRRMGFSPRPNGKVNVGLGRPRYPSRPDGS